MVICPTVGDEDACGKNVQKASTGAGAERLSTRFRPVPMLAVPHEWPDDVHEPARWASVDRAAVSERTRECSPGLKFHCY